MDVYCFDHTIEALPENDERLHFNRIGISAFDDTENNLLSIGSILKMNHHEKREILLKMDIEGAEWGFLSNISSDVLKHFPQMTFELHGLTYMENGERMIASLEKINRTHQAVWLHANNNGGAERAGDIVVPRLLEITYVSKEKYSCAPTEYDCPLSIDAPNIEEYPDIGLFGWGSLNSGSKF